MTAPQASTRREFLGAIGTGGLLVVGLAGVTGVVASGCSGGGAGQPTPTSADPGDSEVTVVPVLPELPDDDPLRHWSSLTSRAVLDFGRLVAEVQMLLLGRFPAAFAAAAPNHVHQAVVHRLQLRHPRP